MDDFLIQISNIFCKYFVSIIRRTVHAKQVVSVKSDVQASGGASGIFS